MKCNKNNVTLVKTLLASINNFDSNRKNVNLFFEAEVSKGNACHIKIHLHVYRCFLIDVEIKFIIFSNLLEF